ncbi:MAG: ABC transporter ATP-binding protein [Candidatus Gracilibacteria bacterium]|nr:ABC transporter ATP-binding protein [Candidatus Gracilibacteria bacterium]
MQSPLIQTEGISKSYILGNQELEVLKGIDLQIDVGEFVSIMGQSGSGKSTLMNIIGMLDIPSHGKYRFNGQDVSELSSDDLALVRRQNIGFIFQNYNLLPRMSAWDQVMVPLLYQGVTRSLREERAFEALKKVGLADKLKSLPSEMSGGQQQRVAVARAIVSDPLLILGDEPTGALDSRTGNEVMELISLLHEEGKTVVIITHSSEIDTFAKRHIFMKDGLIV